MALLVVLAVAVGTAAAKDKPADTGNGKGPEQVAAATPDPKVQITDKGRGKGPEKQVTYVFKRTIAQDGAEGSPLKVKVAKANNAARSFVGKQLEFAVSSDTEIYLDKAGTQHPELEAKLPELKEGDKVVVQAKSPRGATSFTASMISTETPSSSTGEPSPSKATTQPSMAK